MASHGLFHSIQEPAVDQNQDDILATEPFILSHSFKATPELLFKLHTQPDHLKHWWKPKDFSIIKDVLDLKPGGTHHYGLRSEDGFEMWGKVAYLEIASPAKIVGLVQFSDKDGGTTRHPMCDTWPLTVQSTTTFEQDGESTKLTVHSLPYQVSQEEIDTFDLARDSMGQGLLASFQKLEAYLQQLATQELPNA
jgi:uncharacterized protein YndB with AHSA1/START domain